MSKLPVSSELRKMPEDYDFQPDFDIAQETAYNYAVVFAGEHPRKGGRIGAFGSGTLVSIGGVHGILTANHVPALGIYKPERKEFYICYKASGGERPLVPVTPHQFVHVVVGIYHESHEEEGPDLSMMVLTDKQLIESLERIKSFYSLEEQIDM